MRNTNKFVNDQNLQIKSTKKFFFFSSIFFPFVQFMSSITQIIVTCAFSVLACVLRCTVQTQREGCEFYFIFFCFKFAILCRSGGLIFGVWIVSVASV